jgi:hypothetical protein
MTNDELIDRAARSLIDWLEPIARMADDSWEAFYDTAEEMFDDGEPIADCEDGSQYPPLSNTDFWNEVNKCVQMKHCHKAIKRWLHLTLSNSL